MSIVSFKTLRSKVLIPVLLIFIIGTMVLTGSSFILARDIIERDIKNLAVSKVGQLTTELQAELTLHSKEIESLAQTAAVKTMDWELICNYLGEREGLFQEYDDILLVDSLGQYQALSSHTDSIGDRDYFHSAFYRGENAVSEPVVSRVSGQQGIVFASPVKDAAGNIQGVLAGIYRFESIAKIIHSYTLGDTGYAYFINKEGLVLYHPDPQLLSTSMLAHASTDLARLTQDMIDQKSGVDQYASDGTDRIIAYNPVGVNGWSLAMTADYSEISKDVNTLLRTSVLITLGLLAAIIVAIALIITRITAPLVAVGKAAREVAGGNLGVRVAVRSSDEIGALAADFNTMVENLKNLIFDLKKTAETLSVSSQDIQSSIEESAGAAENISRTMQYISQGITEQAGAAVTGSQAVDAVVKGLNGITEDMADSEKLTITARRNVEAGVNLVHFQKEKMQESKQATERLALEITNLSAISTQIHQIIQVIGGIADQTNLLALNAAIEAARAGEHGRGFSVVADEVRKLAEESARATDKIGELINNIQDGVHKAVEEMDTAGQVINAQEEAVQNTTKAFEDIHQLIANVSDQINKVSDESEDLRQKALSAGSEVQNIASIAEQSAASTEQAAASSEEQTASMEQLASAAEELSKLGAGLQESIQKFKL